MHKSHKLILLTIGIIAILALSLTLLPELTQKKPTVVQKDPSNVILKVGQESIYQKDLDYELQQVPRTNTQDAQTQEALKQKLIRDSVALQQGVKEKLITVDSSIYNSPNKNYQARIKAVENVKKIVNAQADRITGTVVSIWFNNSVIGPLGLEKSKELAKKKMDAIYQRVATNAITVDQAVAEIKKDTSLKQIDAAYVANAEYKFNVTYGNRITMDKDFDLLLWDLKVGELTPVVALKPTNKDPNTKEEDLYAFGKVEGRIKNPGKVDYETWIKENQNAFATTNY